MKTQSVQKVNNNPTLTKRSSLEDFMNDSGFNTNFSDFLNMDEFDMNFVGHESENFWKNAGLTNNEMLNAEMKMDLAF